MNHAADRIWAEMHRKNSVLVVGLDPDPARFPASLLSEQDAPLNDVADAIEAFGRIVIDAVADHAVAVKPQLAYYERYGSLGIRALERTIRYAHARKVLVVNDAKRGDIGPTSAAYAQAYLAGDMVTVNPYLGRDGYMPFVEEAGRHGRGLFILLKTSNSSSADLQDVQLANGEPMYVHLAKDLNRLAADTAGGCGYSFVGAVVGATFPQEAELLRRLLPHTLFLVPGFGAQGGKAEDLRGFFDARGGGALISSSRGILYAYMQDEPDWRELTRAEVYSSIRLAALTAKEQVNEVRR